MNKISDSTKSQSGVPQQPSASMAELKLSPAPTPTVDRLLARSFLRALARLTQPGTGWGLMEFPMLGRPYQIPERSGVGIVTAPSPELRKEFNAGIRQLCRTGQVKKLFIYDTRLSPEVEALCKSIAPFLQQLVIRDHHGERKEEQGRAEELRKLFGERASIQVVSRGESPTCFELVAPHAGELLRAGLGTLVVTAPLDPDALNCVAKGFGLRYPGQERDLKVLEAKGRGKVSAIGDLILDAMRVRPMVVRGRGSETFSSLLQVAAFQFIEECASKEVAAALTSPAGETLMFLRAIARLVKADLVADLLKRSLRREIALPSGQTINLVTLDLVAPEGIAPLLMGSLAQASSSLSFQSIAVRLELSVLELARELFSEPDRLRMSTLEDTCAELIRREELPRDCLVAVRYPLDGDDDGIVRCVGFGECRWVKNLGNFPGELSPKGIGKFFSFQDYSRWLGREGHTRQSPERSV